MTLTVTPRTRIVVKDGIPTIIREQDCEPIVEHLKEARAANPSGYSGRERVWKRKGMIPSLIMEQKLRELVDPYDWYRMKASERSKLWLEIANRTLDDPDFKDFRATEPLPNARSLGRKIEGMV